MTNNQIEDLSIEVDIVGEGSTPTAFLRLSGDFVNACEEYLADDDADSIAFILNRTEAEKLYKELEDILFAG